MIFPSSLQDAMLFIIGGSWRAAWAGIRTVGGTPVFRVRAGYMSRVLEAGQMHEGTAFVDISDFPRDDKNHSLAIYIRVNRGIMVWIDGTYKGEGGCYGSIGGGSWVGGARGKYGYSTSARLIEPTSAWPSPLSSLKLYGTWAFSIGPKCVDASDFTSIDVDGDGIISAAEYRAHVGDYGIADTDGDGTVSGSELAEYQTKHGGSGNMTSVDVNGDGAVSKGEFDAYTGSMASADSNGDGSVSDDELDQYMNTYGE
jgi:hypothetical protein